MYLGASRPLLYFEHVPGVLGWVDKGPVTHFSRNLSVPIPRVSSGDEGPGQLNHATSSLEGGDTHGSGLQQNHLGPSPVQPPHLAFLHQALLLHHSLDPTCRASCARHQTLACALQHLSHNAGLLHRCLAPLRHIEMSCRALAGIAGIALLAGAPLRHSDHTVQAAAPLFCYTVGQSILTTNAAHDHIEDRHRGRFLLPAALPGRHHVRHNSERSARREVDFAGLKFRGQLLQTRLRRRQHQRP